MLTIRKVYKTDELKRFKDLEGKYHYMGKTHSGGETMRLVIEDCGEWGALMVWGSACRELPELWLRRFHYRPLLAETFCDIERTAATRSTARSSRNGCRRARRRFSG